MGNLKIIITGSSGMVGKAALLECVESNEVDEVLIVNRNSIAFNHPKVKEVLLKDFMNFSSIKDKLIGYDACLHCMGISSAGMSEEKYHHITFNMTKALVDTLFEQNPDMVFSYVSGAGTDSSEKGRIMWARVKGKTENYILKIGFRDAYALRPGAILPEKGVKSRTRLYNAIYLVIRPFFPLMRKMKSVITSANLGIATIKLIEHPQKLKHLENADLNLIAKL